MIHRGSKWAASVLIYFSLVSISRTSPGVVQQGLETVDHNAGPVIEDPKSEEFPERSHSIKKNFKGDETEASLFHDPACKDDIEAALISRRYHIS